MEQKTEYIDYQFLLEKVCDEVYCDKMFGDYQGTYIAKVKMKDRIFWTKVYYGSCTCCDPLQAFLDDEKINDRWEDNTKTNQKKLLHWFKYMVIEDEVPYEELLKDAKEALEWDFESQELVKFLEENK